MLSFQRGRIRGQKIAIKVPCLVRYENILVVVGELNSCGPLGENPVINNIISNATGLSNLVEGGLQDKCQSYDACKYLHLYLSITKFHV